MFSVRLLTVIIIVLVTVNCCTSTYKPYYCSRKLHETQESIDVNQTCVNITGSKLPCKCRDECGPAIFSVPVVCVDCRESQGQWIGIIILNLSILTLLFFACVLLNINVAACPLNAIAYFYQMVVMFLETYITEDMIHSKRPDLKILATVYGVFNLDFFRYVIPPQCIPTGHMEVIYLEYILAIFPFLLCLIAYLLIKLHDKDIKCVVRVWRPFSKCFKGDKWNPRVTIINTYITFFLLSQSKVVFTSFKFLYTYTYTTESKNKTFLYYIPEFDYSDANNHLSYRFLMSLSLVIVFIFVIAPILLQVLYPTKVFWKCINKCHCLRQDILNILMDAFQGWYKDGTNGSRDYRYMSVVFMVLRLRILPFRLVKFAKEDRDIMFTIVVAVVGFVHGIIGIFYFTVQPYKRTWMNNVDGSILVMFAMHLCTVGVLHICNSDVHVNSLVLALLWMYTLPLLCGLFYLLYRLHVSCKKHKILKRSKAWLGQRAKSHTRHSNSRYPALINVDQEDSEMTSSITADRLLHASQYEASLMNRNQPNPASAEAGGKG